ncbi:MAG: hypothetical protein U1B78_06400 [Dehalococcoidia bacterium]|nr:hypothetical protein [Dehalococcoidia bacterium]
MARRGPCVNSSPRDMQAPDGLIDLFVDIFGVAAQFGHNCA